MEIITTLFFVVIQLINVIVAPYFKYKYRNKRQFLPALKDDILRVSATELAKKIRQKEISSLEICEAYIERVRAVNPLLNAVIEDRFKEARREARRVDGYLKTTSLSLAEVERFKPLLGVPITVKESCAVKGLSLSVGLQSRIGIKAEHDGEAVARLKSAGAIVLLVSATPQLCLAWETLNPINGRTNNPYDTTCTSGGSSGGEGALLGAGASLIGIGSDAAGSVRLPAMFNGVFGHKPTPRMVPLKGHWPFCKDEKYYDFVVIGPMARYACDLKLLMRAMCNDKISAELKLNNPVDLSKLNVFYIEDLSNSIFLPRVVKDMRVAVCDSAKYLHKHCGSNIKEYKFRSFENARFSCCSEIYSIKDIPNALQWDGANFAVEAVKSLFGKSRYTVNLMHFYLGQMIYQKIVSNYSDDIKKMKNEVSETLGDNGIIILPTSTTPAPIHKQLVFGNFYGLLTVANALGLPSTAVPCGFDDNGMPVGVQIMAAPYQDRLCFAVAEELERHFGGWIAPPEKN